MDRFLDLLPAQGDPDTSFLVHCWFAWGFLGGAQPSVSFAFLYLLLPWRLVQSGHLSSLLSLCIWAGVVRRFKISCYVHCVPLTSLCQTLTLREEVMAIIDDVSDN